MRFTIFSVTLILLSLAIFVGCSKEEEAPEPPSITAPQMTTIAYTDSIKVVWEDSPEAGESGFEGYYFYVSNTDLSDLSESELDTYLFNTTPELFNEYLLTDYGGAPLEINAIYYFGIRAVRAVDGRDTLSPLRVTETSPVIVGSGRVYEYSSDSVCAFNFEQGVAITSSETSPEPDFYLDDYPEGASGLAIKSPHLAGDVWTGLQSQFKTLGTGNLDDYPETDDTDFADFVDVTTKVCAIRSVGNNYIKFQGTFGGIAPNRYIDFTYKFQTRANYPHF